METMIGLGAPVIIVNTSLFGTSDLNVVEHNKYTIVEMNLAVWSTSKEVTKEATSKSMTAPYRT